MVIYDIINKKKYERSDNLMDKSGMAILGLMGAVIGVSTGLFDVYNNLSDTVDDLSNSEEKINELNTRLAVLEAQKLDVEHENIVTRIINAQEILKLCKNFTPIKVDRIENNLFESYKKASLYYQFQDANELLIAAVDELENCEKKFDSTPNYEANIP